MQKVKKVLLAVSILAILSVRTVSAQESMVGGEEPIEQGSIQIILPDESGNLKKEGVEFQCIRVADLVNGEYFFFQDLPIEKKSGLQETMTAEEQEQIAKALAEQEYDSKIERTDQNGELLFEDLTVGVYLLKAKDGKAYGTISPALVAVPTWNEIEKEMEYQVKVIPKYTKEVQQSVKTGDSEDMTGYVVAAWIALFCIGGLWYIERRTHYGRK